MQRNNARTEVASHYIRRHLKREMMYFVFCWIDEPILAQINVTILFFFPLKEMECKGKKDICINIEPAELYSSNLQIKILKKFFVYFFPSSALHIL